MYDPEDYLYSHDPMTEELTIEHNAREDYYRELAALEGLDPEFEIACDEARDEEILYVDDIDLDEEIPF